MQVAIIILIVLVVFVFVFQRRMMRGNKNYGSEYSEFSEREHEANFVRGKEIPDELFYTPDLSALPLDADAKHKLLIDKITALAARKMIRLETKMTNTELKFAYGAVNLEYITECEENLFKYTGLLNEFAAALYKDGLYDKARQTALVSAAAGSDTFACYRVLADVYANEGDKEALDNIKSEITASDMDGIIKNKIVTYIDTIKDGLE